MDLTPEQTTTTGVSRRTRRSAETSPCSRAHPVYAAQTARGEDSDAGAPGQEGRVGRGGAAAGAAGQGDAQVAEAELGRGGPEAGQALQLRGREAHAHAPLQDGAGRRYGAARADGLLSLAPGGQVVGVGQAVGEHGGLQRHHGPAGVQSGLHHVGHDHREIHAARVRRIPGRSSLAPATREWAAWATSNSPQQAGDGQDARRGCAETAPGAWQCPRAGRPSATCRWVGG